MKKKFLTGIVLGSIAGLINVLPMILQHLSWDANLSVFSLWLLSGLFLAISQMPFKGIAKGLIISVSFLIPSLIILIKHNPSSLMPALTITVLLGSLLGLLYQKIIKE